MQINPTLRGAHAFTLIELLVVISIIGLLAGLVVGLAGVASNRQKIKKTQAELEQLVTAIESCYAKKRSYPPDNQLVPNNPGTNQLYYELVGTTNDGTVPSPDHPTERPKTTPRFSPKRPYIIIVAPKNCYSIKPRGGER